MGLRNLYCLNNILEDFFYVLVMCINVRFVRPSKTIRSIFYWTFWRKYKLPLRNPLRVRYTSENLLGVFILTDARITKLQSPSAPNVPVRMKNTLIIYDRLAVASRQRVWSCCLHFSSFWCWKFRDIDCLHICLQREKNVLW